MKKIGIIWVMVVLAYGCNGDNVPNCFQNTGDVVQEVVEVGSFDKITVFENLQLVVKQGPEQEVRIETGEFLLEEVTAEVIGDRLVLRNTNNCNLFRDYGVTKVVVTSPNITEIRSSTGWPITGEGILGFSDLLLITESFNNPETETTDGSFDLEVATQTLRIVANGIAYFQVRGTTENLMTTIAAGDSRVEAENLVAQNVTLDHRGSNDILVNPQQSLRGVIRGTGDVVSVNRPALVDVEVLYKGQLIFRD